MLAVETDRQPAATFNRTAVDDARLFSHEERPAEVAAALLPVLTGQRER